MRKFTAIVSFVLLAAACGTVFAGEVERLALWPEMDEWLAGEGQGFMVPTVETTDWVGFISEGNRIRGLDTGHSFRYTFDRQGEFYLGVILIDDPDGIERLQVSFNGRDIGTIFGADDNGKALYSFAEKLTAKPGDVLDFTCLTPVGCYRIYDLVFAKKPITPPRPQFRFIETWSTKPGNIDICWTTTGIVGTGRITCKTVNSKPESAASQAEGRNHRIRLSGLDSTEEYTGRIITTWQGKELASEPFTFQAAPKKPASSQELSIELALPEPTDTPRHAWPVTIGIPFERGKLAQQDDLSLFDPQGRQVTLQTSTTSLWDDGSVKWVTLDFLANSGANNTYRLKSKSGGAVHNSKNAQLLIIEESPRGWDMTTGATSFTIAKSGSTFFGQYGFDRNRDGIISAAEWTYGAAASGLVMETEDRQILTCAAPKSVDVTENGPIRAVVESAGSMLGSDGDKGWRYLVRLTFWKGMPGMAVNVTLWNGDAEPLFRKVRRVSVNVPMAGAPALRGAFQGDTPAQVKEGEEMRLFQDQDSHYIQSCGAEKKEGERALGLVLMNQGEGTLSLLYRDFWQTYPSALELDANGLRVDLLPALAPDAYTIENAKGWYHRLYQWFEDGCYLMRAGQTTQHEFYIWFNEDENKQDAVQQSSWFTHPLLAQASPEYLCSTGVLGSDVFPKTPGVWDSYETFFDSGFKGLVQARESDRMYGWMNFGDWYGERGYNAGNNEYDLAWCLGLQWMRTGDRQYFTPGLEMARHYATVDTIRGAWTENVPGVVWEHSFNHVGTRRTPDALGFDEHARNYAASQPGTFEGGMDPQGHIFEDGVWLYGLLTGDAFLLETAGRVCTSQADFLTPTFDFEIERGGGWPLINATGAYLFTGNPYYLNAARIMVQRCLERHDPKHGGWPHVPPLNETLGVAVVGGKAFATGVLGFGLLRYLNVEPRKRPDVEQMMINTADWLMNESWEPGNGFKYITNAPNYIGKGHRGHECVMNADIIGYAYEKTGDKKYLEFWEEMMAGAFDVGLTGWGKGFSQGSRQTIFGLVGARKAGITNCKPLEKK